MSDRPAPHQITTWQDAEVNAATWMRSWGFADAAADPGGSDGGLDIVSTEAVAQVKFQGAPVGRPALQNLVGADMWSARRLLFFTGSNFAGPAVEYAEGMRIALFRYDPWGNMEPLNTWAHELSGRPQTMSRQRDKRRAVTPDRKTAIKAHFRKHWAVWLAVSLVLAPFGSLGDPTVYTGPLALDLLKGLGIFVGLWLLGLMFAVVYAEQRGFRHPLSAQATRIKNRLDKPRE